MTKYILPDKTLLDKKSEEIEEIDEYYNLSKILLQKDINNPDKKLEIYIGRNKDKEKYNIDLKETSGLFVAGETGSGKSVFLDSLIITLLYKNTPEELNFLLIDPNKIELINYNGIPHLLEEVSTTKQQVLISLKKISDIIQERIKILQEEHITNIETYNKKIINQFPHIVIIIDESTTLMEEEKIKGLLEEILIKGQKLGVHLILATSAYLAKDFDKDFLKLFKHRLTFDLASKEQATLINLKDSNWLNVSGEIMINTQKENRYQAPYISTEEINRVVDFIKNQNNN